MAFIGTAEAMPGCDLDTALALAEKLRRAVEERCGITTGDVGRLSITVSIGVAVLGDGHASVSELVDEADQALYAAKADGRNRVSSMQPGASRCEPRQTQTAS